MAYSDVIALGPAFILDPSDLTSIYQERQGGANGAAGQPVGLWLDKSQMGNNTAAAFMAAQTELVTNGDFSGGSTGWTVGGGWSTAGGVATASNSSNNLTQDILTIGKWYRIQFTISGYSAGTLRPYCGLGNPGIFASSNGTHTAFLKCASNVTMYLAATSFTGVVDNVTVKEVPGNHLLAVSDAGRPTLQERGGLYAVDYDGSDDRMTGAVQFGSVAPRAILGVAFDNFGTPIFRPVFDNGRYFIQGRETGGNYHPRYTTAGKLDYDFTTLTTPKGVASVWGFAIDAGWDITATADGVGQTVAGSLDSTNSAYGIEIGYGQSYFMDGRIWAMALFDKDLTSGEQATAEAWAREKCKFILSAAAGAFPFTGQAATLTYTPITGYTLTAAAGAFGFNGQAANLLVGRKVAADVGAFPFAGQAANLLFGRRLVADAGSFGFAGQAAGLLKGSVLGAGSGAFPFAGQDANLVYGALTAYTLTAASGSFGFNGQDAALRYSRRLQADAGAFAFTGQDATLTKGGPTSYVLVAESGAFAFTGMPADLRGPAWTPVAPAGGVWTPTADAAGRWEPVEINPQNWAAA